jgi:hypothetical protein
VRSTDQEHAASGAVRARGKERIMKIAARAWVAGLVSMSAGLAMAQQGQASTSLSAPRGDGMPKWAVAYLPDPASPEAEQERQRAKSRVEIERELRKIRAQYIRGVRNTEIRQIGLHKIRQFTDPAAFPVMLEVFRRDGDDVIATILDHLAEQRSDEADTVLAWTAVFDEKENLRAAASDRLLSRAEEEGEVSNRVQIVIAGGLQSEQNDEVAASAVLAEQLKLYEAIPMLITAQVGGDTRGSARTSSGPLAWIMVAQQQAFVSDLQPVVGDSAVAFDPEISVVTEGVLLRVFDATVITYRVDVHNALVRMTSDRWGRSTESLGWDTKAWREWYAGEFKPMLEREASERGNG